MIKIHCPYDTHEKELGCLYYEHGMEKLGCFCKYMNADLCGNKDRIAAYHAGKEEMSDNEKKLNKWLEINQRYGDNPDLLRSLRKTSYEPGCFPD